ncbi:MAG: SRPBCC family protein [Bacteroidota bacterium]
MEKINKPVITAETIVNKPVEKVWLSWTTPAHITQWNQASDDWHAPYADNDLRVGGRFKITMAARDGSFSFDFEGTYTDVQPHTYIAYNIDDQRRVEITFKSNGDQTVVIEHFEAEDMHSIEMQQGGWQAILDSFKKYTEENL